MNQVRMLRTHPMVSMLACLFAGVTNCSPGHAMDLTAAGQAEGYSLSTFYSEPLATYGLLSVTTASTGEVIATSLSANTLNLLADVDGQGPASILKSASLDGRGVAFAAASVGGRSYISAGIGAGGGYLGVDPNTLALTPLLLDLPARPFLGLWGNQATGHLLSSSSLGLIDIDPLTGAVHVINDSPGGFDGVTATADGRTAYGDYAGNIYGYDIASGRQVAFFSGNGRQPDGLAVISGGRFDGDIIANNNDGTLGRFDHVTGVETIIAEGGHRGDYVGADLTNGTLFVTNLDQVVRLGLPGAAIGSPVPEPPTVLLAATALGLFEALRRRRVASAHGRLARRPTPWPRGQENVRDPHDASAAFERTDHRPRDVQAFLARAVATRGSVRALPLGRVARRADRLAKHHSNSRA